MPLRLLQVRLPREADLTALVAEHRVLSVLQDLRSGRQVVQIAVEAAEAEALGDRLEAEHAGNPDLEVVVLAIEALWPRPSAENDEREEGEDGQRHRDRLSRDELYADVTEGLAVTPTYVALALLAAVVATLGLLRDDVAVIIGAMVIAPLLRPAVAQALAVTLGDHALGRRAFVTGAVGLALSLAPALLAGWLFPVDPTSDAIAARSSLDLGALGLALAAGAAGTLAFTRGLAGAVIGVMVAVAILPPLATFGLLLAGGFGAAAVGALLLTAGNLLCINLAGVATFLLQGVRPRGWSEARRARRTTLVAMSLWLLLLAAVVAIVLFAGLEPPTKR